ncbi:MAG: IS3 family transposase [Fuerstiella sp.]|nr:IS3 family transposase [Fuerstiella sp.]MCP4507897.1 IS3 family transposase [Fuerstiella sp.]
MMKESGEGKLPGPERRRRAVDEVRRKLRLDKISQRCACRVPGQSRATQRYQPRRPADERRVIKGMRSIARRRGRFGSPRVYRELRADGWRVNHKRI